MFLNKLKKYICFLFALSFVVFAALSVCGCSFIDEDSYTNSSIVFGSEFSVIMYGDNSSAAFEEMLAILDGIDAEISLSDESSTFYQFAAAAKGSSVEISQYAYEMLTFAIEYNSLSGGYFDIGLNRASELWHVDVNSASYFAGSEIDFELPSIEEVNAIKDEIAQNNSQSIFGIEIDYDETTQTANITKLYDNVVLDLGALAKGYCADLCIEIAKNYGIESALVKLSGNIKVIGQEFTSGAFENWRIGVSSPRPRDTLIRSTLFALEFDSEMSIVTSGDYERYYYFEQGGEAETIPICHIINPFTAMPLGISYDEELGAYIYDENAVIAATIVDECSVKADAIATAVCLMSYDEAKDFLLTNDIDGAVMTSEKIAFVGISELYEEEVYNGFTAYEVEYLA